MSKSLGSELNEPLDAAASREERRATGRLVAVIVALLMIFSGFYHAWIKRIPVLAGVMVPALIMLLYAAWVLFLAKREKKRRLNAENHIRSSMTALSDILVMPPSTSTAVGDAIELRRLSHCSDTADRRLSHTSMERMRLQPSALQLMLLHQQYQLHLQQQQEPTGGGSARRAHRKDRHHHHNHHPHSHHHHTHRGRRGSAIPPGSAERHHLMLAKRPSLVPDVVVTPTTPIIDEEDVTTASTFIMPRRPSLVRSLSTR